MITMTNISRQVSVDALTSVCSELRPGAGLRLSVRRLAAPKGVRQGTTLSSASHVGGESTRIESPSTSEFRSYQTTQRPVPGTTAWSPPVL